MNHLAIENFANAVKKIVVDILGALATVVWLLFSASCCFRLLFFTGCFFRNCCLFLNMSGRRSAECDDFELIERVTQVTICNTDQLSDKLFGVATTDVILEIFELQNPLQMLAHVCGGYRVEYALKHGQLATQIGR